MTSPAFVCAFIMAFIAGITTEESAPSLLSYYIYTTPLNEL